MRNLKKVLSLVLVVAMLASMMIVGAAAAETETTNYPEAAAVISGIGVMEGDENGMRYADTVTREEAAAIICRAILGDASQTLKTATAPFADVAASRWSAGYIAYLKAKGIISGVSATEFDPTAKVTGVAFAKMLLTAVGYGKNAEFEGAQWDINTITFANQTGLFAGSKAADLTAPATREECMLYAFNTITAIPVVNYNKTFDSYYVGSNPLNEPASKAAFTLAYSRFNLRQTPGAAANEYGRPSVTWTVDGKTVVDAATSEAPVATYTNGTTAGVVYAALTKSVVDNATITYTVNGTPTTAPTLTNAGAGAFVAIGGLGDTVEVYSVYDGAGNYEVYIVVVSENYSTVKSVNATTKLVTLTDGATIDGTAIDVTGLAKGDHVLYTKIGSAVKTVKEITAVSMTYTANKAATAVAPATIVADGATYTIRFANTYTAAANFNVAYDMYFDTLGNVVFMKPTTNVVTSYEYIYVNAAEAQIATNSLINAVTNKVAISVTYPTGGNAVVYAEIFTDPATFAQYIMVEGKRVDLTGKATVEAAITEGWYTFTTGTTGGIILGDIAAASDYATVVGTLGVTAGAAKLTGTAKTAGAGTTLTLVDAFGNATVKTGIANFATASYTNALITYAKGSKAVTAIYVTKATAAAPAPVLVYCVAQGNNVATGTEYTVVGLDGAVQNIVVSTGSMDPTGLYTITAAGNNTYTAAAYTTGVFGAPVNAGNAYDAFFAALPAATVATFGADYFIDTEVVDDEGTVTTAAKTYYFDANTVVVDVTGAGATAVAEGSVFVATVNNAAENAYKGLDYCTTIWIIG